MHVLRHEIQAQVAVHARTAAAGVEPAEDAFLGDVERIHHLPVLLRQRQPAHLHVHAAHRLEQRGLEPQVVAQHAVELGQVLLHRLEHEHRAPQHRQQPVPRGATQQQRGLQPCPFGRAALVGDADGGVDGEDQRAIGNGLVALADGAQHGDAEGARHQPQRKPPRPVVERLHRERRERKRRQRDQQRPQPPAPAVIRLGNGAGDGAQQQRHDVVHLVQHPAAGHDAGQRDEDAQAVGKAVHRPEAAQGVGQRGHGKGKAAWVWGWIVSANSVPWRRANRRRVFFSSFSRCR